MFIQFWWYHLKIFIFSIHIIYFHKIYWFKDIAIRRQYIKNIRTIQKNYWQHNNFWSKRHWKIEYEQKKLIHYLVRFALDILHMFTITYVYLIFPNWITAILIYWSPLDYWFLITVIGLMIMAILTDDPLTKSRVRIADE